MNIKSIVGTIHDTSFGGYPYKITVAVELSTKEYNKLCPKVGTTRPMLFGRSEARRDKGNMVLIVNNLVYVFNKTIPAYNPIVDTSNRSKNGVKTVIFKYLFKNHATAEKLGYKIIKLSGWRYPGYNQYITLK